MNADFLRRIGRGLVACSVLATAVALEVFEDAIFDEGLIIDGQVEIVNGRIVLKTTSEKPEENKPEADPAGEQVLELTDGSQLNGSLVSLGRTEVVWQRADATAPLTFSPQEVRRLVLRPASAKDVKANATLKLGADWIAGDVADLKEGKFQVTIGEATRFEIERGRVEWLALGGKDAPSPDAYDGPVGAMGLSGWDTSDSANSWDYADGALVARSANQISRAFDVMPERMDLQFTAGDGGSSNRGLTLWLQPGVRTRGYSMGSCYLRFQANTVTANVLTGEAMKTFSAEIEAVKDEKKLTRYRLLHDRRAGRLVVFVNGKQIADWDFPEMKEPARNGSISWQPSYYSSNMAWTLSNIRVQPWDGDPVADAKEHEEGKDLIKAAATERKAGVFEGLTPSAVRFSGAEVPRTDAIFLRLASQANAEPPPAAIARVWLATRGEFDVTGIGFKDGVLKVRTAFAGDLALPSAVVRAIEFPHKLAAAEKGVADGGDTLIFKNGNQLRGTLLGASHDKPLQWKPVKGEKPVEFTTSAIAGVVLAPRGKADTEPPGKGDAGTISAAVRFHNGDWLPGEMLGLDAANLRLRTPLAGEMAIERGAVRTVYFSAGAEVPAWDGASDREVWMNGTAVPGYSGGFGSDGPASRKKDDRRPSPWRYLDGAFTLVGAGARNIYSGAGPNLGRVFETLSEKVDVSFELSTTKGPANYIVSLFVDENRQGIMVQGGWDSAYLYDNSPRRNAGFGGQPQQLDFGSKIGSEGNRRHFRFLGDRKTGRLWMYVNGQFVGSLGKRAGGGPTTDSPKSAKGIAIMAQPQLARVTISNLWIAPWSGALPPGSNIKPKTDTDANAGDGAAPKAVEKVATPGEAAKALEALAEQKAVAAAPEPATAPTKDAVALANGDETLGTVVSATAEQLKLECDVGEIDVPLARALLVDFAGKPHENRDGVRMRFTGKGALTMGSFRIEEGRVICRSAVAGELSFPLSALTEIIFSPNVARPFEKVPGVSTAPGSGGIQIQRRIIVR
jgi:hypothetical protein